MDIVFSNHFSFVEYARDGIAFFDPFEVLRVSGLEEKFSKEYADNFSIKGMTFTVFVSDAVFRFNVFHGEYGSGCYVFDDGFGRELFSYSGLLGFMGWKMLWGYYNILKDSGIDIIGICGTNMVSVICGGDIIGIFGVDGVRVNGCGEILRFGGNTIKIGFKL